MTCVKCLQTLSVEYIHDAEGKEAIRKLMTSKGYEIFIEVNDANNLANDYIFIKTAQNKKNQ